MKKLIAGNWKMNGSVDDARALIAALINRLDTHDEIFKSCDLVVCPPFVHIAAVRHAIYGFPRLAFGAQDCSRFENGAYTGDTSAKMLKDSGCTYVILGHSERRALLGETSETVAAKVKQALVHDLKPIICVGETQAEREAGKAGEVVKAQLMGSLPDIGLFHEIAIAYEPVWAIGTGKVATPEDIIHMHGHIRQLLGERVKDASKVRILYGGSVKADNAAEIFACKHVDGALIGGASLNAEQFVAIARTEQIH
jgi:triosephosphate isomerase